MIDETTQSVTAGWSTQMGTSCLEDDFLKQWGMRLLCLFLFPVLPLGAVFGLVALFGVPILIIAFIIGAVLGLAGAILSAYIRLFLTSGKVRVDGEILTYTAGKKEAFLLCLKTGLLIFVTLGIYWLIGFSSTSMSKARQSRTTRVGEASNIKRSGFVGNFLFVLIPKILISAIPLSLLVIIGLVPLRQHSERFWTELARVGTRFRPPNMELWSLTKSIARNGFSALGDPAYYNEVTTLVWTAILLFTTFFLLLPWYRHKMIIWETTHTSVDGYRLRFTATFGQYVGNAYLGLLMAAVPATLIVLLIVYQRKIVFAVWLILMILAALALFAVMGYMSLRAARFRAKHTAVLAPPSKHAPWDIYMIPEKELHLTLGQSTRAVFSPQMRRSTANYFKRYWTLYLLLAIPIVYLIIFRYIPMLYIQIGFKQNNIIIPIWDVSWAENYGFGWLVNAFKTRDFALAMRNTLMLNGLDLLLGFPAPVILAIMLNELAFKRYKRITQTIFYMPHFLSWVIIASLSIQLFNGTNGMINMLLKQAGQSSILPFEGGWQWVAMYVLLGIWQGAGWGTIIYLAAITNINPELYEAASVDGANRLSRIWHVTLPGLRPTIIILLIMRMGGIIGSDFERPFALRNPITTQVSDVLSIFVFLRGIRGTQFATGAAVGIFQSVVGLIFLFSANALAKRFGERGVW